MFQTSPPSGAREDPLVKSNKTMPFADIKSPSTLGYLLALVLVGLPLWLFVLLPLAILAIPYHMFRKKRPMAQAPILAQDDPILQRVLAKGRTQALEQGPRRLDLVIFGATGFTGRLAALHLARTYGNGADLRWAIAGRSDSRLQKLAAELRAEAARAGRDLEVEILLADTFNAESLVPVVESARCVVNMAGPFAAFGRPVVQLCAAAGTHYTDITGEVFFVNEMIDRFDDMARETGARIVHMCGHDCTPWSLGVYLAAKELRRRGESVVSARTYSLIKGGVSGGTLRTMFESLEWKKYRPALGYNPLLKDFNGQRSTFKTRIANAMYLKFDKVARAFVGPFIMAPVVARCVVRDNAQLHYGENLKYADQTVYSSPAAGFIQFFGLVIAGTAMANPVLQWAARKYVLPSPGSGPSQKDMDAGFLKLVTVAKGSNNSNVRSTFWCDKEPGYYYTSIMAAEAGLALANNPENPNGAQHGGVYTPGAFAEPIAERLRGAGMLLEVQN